MRAYARARARRARALTDGSARSKAMRAITLALVLPSLASGKGLTDEPLAAAVYQPLSNIDGDRRASWTAFSGAAGISIPAKVPGDLITDLENAGEIGDPLYERNFKGVLWDASNWTFSTEFETATPMLSNGTKYLVLDGVKMGAWVYLNGHLLGAVADQFLRYRFDVTQLLTPAHSNKNELQLVFPPSNHTLNEEARWMACSGAWDWAPCVC